MNRDDAIKLKDSVPIYAVVIGGVEYIFKHISSRDFFNIERASSDSIDIEDNVVLEALLYPEVDIDSMPAGVFRCLFNAIVSVCGLDYSMWGQVIDERKAQYMPVVNHDNTVSFKKPLMPLVLQICKAFPAYKPTEVIEMPIDLILELAALADLMINDFYLSVDDKGRYSLNDDSSRQTRSIGTKSSYSQHELEMMSLSRSVNELESTMQKVRTMRSKRGPVIN